MRSELFGLSEESRVRVRFARNPGVISGRRRKGLQNTIAWLASILLHILAFLFCLSSLKGAAVSGGAGTDVGEPEAISISLAGLHGGARTSGAPSQAELEAIFRNIRAQQSPISATPTNSPPKSNLDSLFATIDEQRGQRNPQDSGEATGQGKSSVDRGGAGSSLDGTSSDKPEKQGQTSKVKNAAGPGSAASTGAGLWGAIAPCWGRLRQVSTVPVTLEITLNPRGQIATPPRIVRPNDNPPTEERLISEARALAAVTACMPYHVAGIGSKGQTFSVDFAKQ